VPSCGQTDLVANNFVVSTIFYYTARLFDSAIFGDGMSRQRFNVILPLVALLFAACGGGGGSGEGGSGGGASGGIGRSTSTGIRVVHGAFDAPPVELRLGTEIVAAGRFAEATRYSTVKLLGPQNVAVELANTGQLLVSLPSDLLQGFEYTLFVTGEARTERLNYVLLSDKIARPAAGSANVRVFHGYEGSSRIVATIGGTALEAVSIGEASELTMVTSGLQRVKISSARSGEVFYDADLTLPDRGEVGLLLTGSRERGMRFLTQFEDLD